MIPPKRPYYLLLLCLLASLFSGTTASAQLRTLTVSILKTSDGSGSDFQTVDPSEVVNVTLYISKADTHNLKKTDETTWTLDDPELLKKLDSTLSYRIAAYDVRNRSVGWEIVNSKKDRREGGLYKEVTVYRHVVMEDREQVLLFVLDRTDDFDVVSERFARETNDYVLHSRTSAERTEEFTMKSKSAFVNKYNQKVYQRLYFGTYQYETPEQCEAALDSLLDCFGTDCAPLKWGDTSRSFKITPTVYIIRDRQIIFCKTACEQHNASWDTFVSEMVAELADKHRYIVVGCGGHPAFGDLR